MTFFGRLSFLVDENAHAVHFFISALLQLLDRTGSLYGEIARFVLRVIFRRKVKHVEAMQQHGMAPPNMQGFPGGPSGPLALTQGPTATQGSGPWDNLWGGR